MVKKKIKTKLLTGMVSIITLGSFFLPVVVEIANASEITTSTFQSTNSTQATIDDYFSKNPVNVPGMSSNEATKIVESMVTLSETAKGVSDKEKSNITNAFKDDLRNTFSLHTDEFAMDFTNVSVFQVSGETGTEDYYTITVPVVDSNLNFFSNVTAVYDMNKHLKGYQETLISKSVKDTFEINSYSNGTQTNHQILEEKFVPNEELQQQLQDVQKEASQLQQTRGLAEKVACLVIVLNISRTIANILAPVCAAACLSVVPVCVACVTGFVALGGASITGVIGCFKL
ncbi:hypothetical protein JZO83_14285 [Enterococcus sp. DIV1298c]|uniref:Uncharacterized protein n=1 Tax=Candidatus Enterococcus mangumiae TaxID=2230878 RepID=A0ABZ2STT2_9ENTE|nr:MULTISPECIES: hypothetical protein [unclassified Enterococcus]MBO0462893.1 hypothetical protein [Enterococcus sp. DIV1298c]MBO0490099.1 hypothetical protein [Enterococcus sp. DIV1094]